MEVKMSTSIPKWLVANIIVLGLFTTVVRTQQLDHTPPPLPDFSVAHPHVTDPAETLNKLSIELRELYEQFSLANAGTIKPDADGVGGFTDEQLNSFFGVTIGERDPLLTLSIDLDHGASSDPLVQAGVSIISRSDDIVVGVAHISSL